jgi:site-specific DNA-methyltransferase (adenine-specific)
MDPYYTDELVTLYHGDAIEVMSEMTPTINQTGRFNAIVTDPPYMIGSLSAGNIGTKTGTWADMMNASLWFSSWYRCAWDMLRDDGCFWTFLNWRSLPVCMKAANDARFGFVSMAVWDKKWIGPGGSQGLRPSYELVGLAAKPDFAIPDRGIADIITHKTGGHKPTGHPAEKPVGLLERLLTISDLAPGAHILDPFAGSGTTGVAARALGIRSTLIEADERYCELITERLSQGVLL